MKNDNFLQKNKPHIAILGMVYSLLFYVPCVVDEKLIHINMLFTSFDVPAPFLFFTFIYPLTNAVTEVYGTKMAWTLLLGGFSVMIVFSLLSLGIIDAPSPHTIRSVTVQNDYNLIFKAIESCMGWGYVAFFIGIYVNVFLLAKYKIKFNGKNYYGRSVIACCISEFIVTVISNIIIWGPRVSFIVLIKIITLGYIFLLIVTPLWAILGKVVKDVLHKIEKTETYIYQKEFNNILRDHK
jgi:queuosine precursor transporter